MADRSAKTLTEMFEREKIGTSPGDSWSDRNIKIEKLLDIVREYCVPMLGAEHAFPDLFGKYGYTFVGIGDGWQWNFAALQDAPEDDLWKMLAIGSTYWYINYARWYNEHRRQIKNKAEFIK